MHELLDGRELRERRLGRPGTDSLLSFGEFVERQLHGAEHFQQRRHRISRLVEVVPGEQLVDSRRVHGELDQGAVVLEGAGELTRLDLGELTAERLAHLDRGGILHLNRAERVARFERRAGLRQVSHQARAGGEERHDGLHHLHLAVRHALHGPSPVGDEVSDEFTSPRRAHLRRVKVIREEARVPVDVHLEANL